MQVPRLALILALLPSASHAEEIYRTPRPDDANTYFVARTEILEPGRLKVLSGTIGPNGGYTDFVELEADCASNRYIELAGGSEPGSHTSPTRSLQDWSRRATWMSAARTTATYDLIRFVCRNQE